MKIIHFIRGIFKQFPLLFISNIVLQALVSLIEALSLFTIGPLVDFLVHPNFQNVSPLTQRMVAAISRIGFPVTLKTYLSFFVLFIVFSSCFRIFARHSILKTKYILCRSIIVDTFKDFFNARWYFFSSRKQGTLLNTFTRELNIVGNAFGAVAIFFASALRLIFCLIIPFYISWQVTCISLVAAFLLTWPILLLGRISYRLGQLNTSTSNQVSTVIQESFMLAKEILGFGNQNKSVENLAKAYDGHCKAAVKSQTISLTIPILYRPFGVIVLAVALVAARHFGVALSEIAVLLLALLQVVISIGDLAARKNSLDNFFPSYEQIKHLSSQARQFKQISGNKKFIGFNKEISIENASFAYPGNSPALKDVNIVIPKGKMIAIVGSSGAGKTTFIDMIMGFNESSTGRIAFDGISLEEFNIESYRRRIGYVPQDSALFNMSILDNLLWSKKDVTMEEIKQACIQANANEFIEKFPKGYDTLVGDRGVRLSGGQRQRVALARAILRKPELLILDEATSSLDTHSERLIQQAIENIAKQTTIIIIAHRLSTIVNADYVYVFKDGKVVEEGTYSDLIKMDGRFAQMVKLQLLGVAE